MYIVRSIHEMITCDDLLDENGFSICDETEDTELLDVSRYRRFHCYSLIDPVNNAIDAKSPIAAFYHNNLEKFFLCFGKKKQKQLLEMKITDSRISLNTFLFNVELDSFDNAKDIAEISLDSTEYLSVLMLPLCYGNDENDVLYYAIADDHKEYCGNANWTIPDILLESTMFSYNSVEEVLDSIPIWDSLEKLNELIGMSVKPINGSTSGVIVSSYFVNGHNTDVNARWTVAYYNGDEVESNICEMKTYCATEIGDITLVHNE